MVFALMLTEALAYASVSRWLFHFDSLS